MRSQCCLCGNEEVLYIFCECNLSSPLSSHVMSSLCDCVKKNVRISMKSAHLGVFLCFGQQKGHPACKNPLRQSPKILFWGPGLTLSNSDSKLVEQVRSSNQQCI